MSWGTQAPNQEADKMNETKTAEPTMRFDEAYYRNLFNNNHVNTIEHRMAFVGHENTLKTGLALSLLKNEIEAGKKVYLFDGATCKIQVLKVPQWFWWVPHRFQ